MAMEQNKRKALQLILLFGLVSLFGDIIYEGARSVNGPYLKVLGANALAVGFIAGLGEFMGYGIRLLSGYFSDKTKSYWFFTIAGYAMLISVGRIYLGVHFPLDVAAGAMIGVLSAVMPVYLPVWIANMRSQGFIRNQVTVGKAGAQTELS